MTERLDDPVWEYVLSARLSAYLPAVRRFWENVEGIDVTGTGVYPVAGDAPPGLMYRVTQIPARSPIKNVQVFPFVPVAYLNILGVPGGVASMVGRACADGRLTLDEFTVVEKHGLPSTYHRGQIVALVPTDVLSGSRQMGRWVYLTVPEMLAILQADVPKEVQEKLIKRV